MDVTLSMLRSYSFPPALSNNQPLVAEAAGDAFAIQKLQIGDRILAAEVEKILEFGNGKGLS